MSKLVKIYQNNFLYNDQEFNVPFGFDTVAVKNNLKDEIQSSVWDGKDVDMINTHCVIDNFLIEESNIFRYNDTAKLVYFIGDEKDEETYANFKLAFKLKVNDYNDYDGEYEEYYESYDGTWHSETGTVGEHKDKMRLFKLFSILSDNEIKIGNVIEYGNYYGGLDSYKKLPEKEKIYSLKDKVIGELWISEEDAKEYDIEVIEDATVIYN